MMVNHVEYWEVWDNFSEGGRVSNANKTIGCFSSKKEADRYAIGKGNYGQAAMVTKKDVFIVDGPDDLAELKKAETKAKALNKLTSEEKEALGL